MLIGNGHFFNKGPGRSLGGGSEAGSRGAWFKSGPRRNAFLGETRSYIPQSAVPDTYSPPYCWTIAIDPGGIGCRYEARGTGEISANLAQGKNCEATLAGVGAITPPSLSMLVQLACTLLGEADLTADMVGTVNMAATLAGGGDIDGALGAIAFCVATLTGTGTIDPSSQSYGIAHMSAEIYVNAGTASTAELAAAVWEALAADFDSAGTMGEKLNAAGTAGDPWTADLTGYGTDTAGEQLRKALTTGKFLALK